MYKRQKNTKQTLKGIEPYKGESIEKKVARVLSNKEAIKDNAPLIYTDRKDGVQPDYDIRTDKYEYLVEGHDALAKSKRAKRDNLPKTETKTETTGADSPKTETGGQKTETGGQSTQTT